jgi:hypothetical protein
MEHQTAEHQIQWKCRIIRIMEVQDQVEHQDLVEVLDRQVLTGATEHQISGSSGTSGSGAEVLDHQVKQEWIRIWK